MNKTKFFMFVEQKRTACDWRQFFDCLFHTQTVRIILNFFRPSPLTMRLSQDSLDNNTLLLIYLFDIECNNKRLECSAKQEYFCETRRAEDAENWIFKKELQDFEGH